MFLFFFPILHYQFKLQLLTPVLDFTGNKYVPKEIDQSVDKEKQEKQKKMKKKLQQHRKYKLLGWGIPILFNQ